MTPAQIIVLATPVFLLLIALEFAVGLARGRNTYRLADALSSIGLGVMSQVTGVFGRLLRIGSYELVFEPAPAAQRRGGGLGGAGSTGAAVAGWLLAIASNQAR